MDEWVWWMIAAGVLAVGEIATVSFFLGPIAVAAVLSAIVALAGAGLAAQWIVFILGSLGSLLVLRPIARLLAARDDVEFVRYPGLPGDPGHEVARRQMSGYAMVVSFDLGSAEHAERFLSAARLVTDATSFGSVHTSAERRARWGGDAVPDGFIRLSAGCEDTADLLADVERALDA